MTRQAGNVSGTHVIIIAKDICPIKHNFSYSTRKNTLTFTSGTSQFSGQLSWEDLFLPVFKKFLICLWAIFIHTSLSDMSNLPPHFPSSAPMNVSVLLYNKLPLENLLIILAGVGLFLFHGCSSPFFKLSSVAFREQSARNISWGLEPGPHAWVTSRESSNSVLTFPSTWFSCSTGAGKRRAGPWAFRTIKGSHFTTEKVRPTLLEKTSKKSSYHLAEHRHLSGIVIAVFLLFYLLVLITTLQSTYCQPHFSEWETETEGWKTASPKTPKQEEVTSNPQMYKSVLLKIGWAYESPGGFVEKQHLKVWDEAQDSEFLTSSCWCLAAGPWATLCSARV